MPATLLFCTSFRVTSDLGHELQTADPECPVPSPWAPARYSAADQHEPSRSHVEDYVDVFAEATDEELQHLHAERPEPKEDRRWLEPNCFVVLDDRSVEDKTVVLHTEIPRWSDDEMYDEIDREIEIVGHYRTSWRIDISACWHTSALMWSGEFQEHLFLKEKGGFTDANGWFDVMCALAWLEHAARNRDGGPKLA